MEEEFQNQPWHELKTCHEGRVSAAHSGQCVVCHSGNKSFNEITLALRDSLSVKHHRQHQESYAPLISSDALQSLRLEQVLAYTQFTCTMCVRMYDMPFFAKETLNWMNQEENAVNLILQHSVWTWKRSSMIWSSLNSRSDSDFLQVFVIMHVWSMSMTLRWSWPAMYSSSEGLLRDRPIDTANGICNLPQMVSFLESDVPTIFLYDAAYMNICISLRSVYCFHLSGKKDWILECNDVLCVNMILISHTACDCDAFSTLYDNECTNMSFERLHTASITDTLKRCMPFGFVPYIRLWRTKLKAQILICTLSVSSFRNDEYLRAMSAGRPNDRLQLLKEWCDAMRRLIRAANIDKLQRMTPLSQIDKRSIFFLFFGCRRTRLLRDGSHNQDRASKQNPPVFLP